MKWINILGWVLAGLGLVSTILNIKKNKLCYITWNISNVLLIIINLVRKDYGQVTLFIIYTIVNTYGFIQWGKEEKE